MTEEQTPFEAVSERILQQFLQYNPYHGRFIGLHEFDGKLEDISREGLMEQVEWSRRELAALRALDYAALGAEQRFDYALLEQYLESVPFTLLELREWENSPLWYRVHIDLGTYLYRDYAPLEERLAGMQAQLRLLPEVMAAMRANLKPPLARAVQEVALGMFHGQIEYMREAVVQALDESGLSAQAKTAFRQDNEVAIAAIEEFVIWLGDVPVNDDYAIGAARYSGMLKYLEGINLPLAEVLAAGERDLARNYAKLQKVARQIDPSATPAELSARLKQDHPSAAEVIPLAQAMLEEIRAFVAERDLITLPGEERPRVLASPPHMRFGFAYMNGAFRYEQSAEFYYLLTLPEAGWPPEQQEKWLTFFNRSFLQVVSIHEVYPGHFVHIRHLRENPNRVRTILPMNGSHVEGLAHYMEQLMLDEGYGADRPEIRFSQLEAALMRDCRYIAAIKMHTQGMTVNEAVELFMSYCNMEENTARAEALRGTWQPGYLFYTLGKLMLLKLREDLKKRDGPAFSLKAFHDDCVRYGGPPVPLLRRHLLPEDPDAVL